MSSEDIKNIKGNIINIQHYSYQDGPGVRTTVFLKGCPLRCKWCSNPESISPQCEVAYDPKDCIGVKQCGQCLKKPFPEGSFTIDEKTGKAAIDWKKKKEIDPSIVSLCPGKAIFTYGKEVTVTEVMEEVDQDAAFYSSNNGGITVSGGEPLLQPEFVEALLKTAHTHGYSTAIETALNVPWKNIEKAVKHVDILIHDIKTTDPEQHRKWTGVSNERILENVIRIYENFPDKKVIVRTPVIPGVNDRIEVIDKIIDFIIPYKNVIKYELLPYHRFGLGKYGVLGKEYSLSKTENISDELINELRDYVSKRFEAERPKNAKR